MGTARRAAWKYGSQNNNAGGVDAPQIIP